MILEGGPGKSPLQFAVNKQDDFAIVSGTDIVRSRNTNTPLKSLAIIIPKSPICFYSFDKANINSAKDWSGKRIALPQNYEVEYYVYAILENAGLPRESVTIQLCSSQAEIEKKLIDNEVDIISGYRTNYPILNESINDKLKTLTLEACGITTVGDTLAAKDVLVNQRRSLVRSFVDATIAGWEYAIQEINEDETLDYVLKYMPHGSDRKYQKYCLLGITNMIGNDFPHEQHEHTWAEIKEFLIKYNLADKDVELFSCFAGY